MPHEQWRCTRRAVLKGAVLALAGSVCAGCDEDHVLAPTAGTFVTIGSFHVVGNGMYGASTRWRDSLTPGDRAIIEGLIGQEDLLIHIFVATGRLRPLDSRGGQSGWASSDDMKRVCDFHPIVRKLAQERNWDVAYDPERTKWFEDNYGIPTPPEVVLYHEFFGHVVPGLRDPELALMTATDELLHKKNECEALDIENRYRKQMGYREVPRELMKCPLPEK